MYWLSSAEAEKLVKSVEDAYEKINRLGPNPIKQSDINSKKKQATIAPVE